MSATHFLDVAQQVETLRKEANRGCGLVYELYVQRFSEAVDHTFPENHPQRADALAAAQGDYLAPEERLAALEMQAEQGLCRHGLEPDCCPAGCGDL